MAHPEGPREAAPLANLEPATPKSPEPSRWPPTGSAGPLPEESPRSTRALREPACESDPADVQHGQPACVLVAAIHWDDIEGAVHAKRQSSSDNVASLSHAGVRRIRLRLVSIKHHYQRIRLELGIVRSQVREGEGARGGAGPATEHMAEETVTSGLWMFDPRRPKKYEPTGTVAMIATTRRKISATAGETPLLFNISRGRVRRRLISRFEPELQRARSRTQDSGWSVGCDWVNNRRYPLVLGRTHARWTTYLRPQRRDEG